MDEEFPELRNCKICKHEKVEQVERDFLNEMITGKEAAIILECTLYSFKNHIERHLKTDIAGVISVNAGPLAKQIFNKTNELISSCDRILEVLDEVITEWKNKKETRMGNGICKIRNCSFKQH